MNSQPKISVIVPVYQVEETLDKCVESIIGQTYKNLEIILVDDGSPDNCPAICDSWAEKDSRIKVIHKENGGVSSARNLGLDNIRGEYVTFVDSDDMIDARTLEICMSRCEGPDMLQFSFSRNVADLGTAENSEPEIFAKEDYVNNAALHKCVWGTVFSSDIIRRNRIRFDEDMKLAEDQLFVFSCMEHVERIMRLPDVLYYYYYDNPTSATNNERCNDLIHSSQRCIDFKKKHPLFARPIDETVIYLIEKLIARGKYSASYKLLSELKPHHAESRPWPSRLMVRISRCSSLAGICIGAPLYNVYSFVRKTLTRIKCA